MTKLAAIKGQAPLKTARALEAKVLDQYAKLDGEATELRRMLLEFDRTSCWRALNYASFKAWAADRIPYSTRHAFRLLGAAQVEDEIAGNDGAPPIPERHLRAMVAVDEGDRSEVWAEVCRRAEQDSDGVPVITEKIVKACVDAYLKGKRITEGEFEAPDGTPIEDAELKVVFAEGGFDRIMGMLSNVGAELKRVKTTRAGALLARQIQQVEADRKNLYTAVRFSRPFAICPWCGGAKANCKGCEGRRWVNEEAIKHAPKKK
jgi:hypothetical protein